MFFLCSLSTQIWHHVHLLYFMAHLEISQAPLVFYHFLCIERIWLGEVGREHDALSAAVVKECFWGGEGLKELQYSAVAVVWDELCHMCTHGSEAWLINVTKRLGPERIKYPELTSSPLSLSDETFELGLKFELVMEVRPRVASGVLLHVQTAEGYFTIYIHQGEVSHWYAYPERYTLPGQVMIINHASSVQEVLIQYWCVFSGRGFCERWLSWVLHKGFTKTWCVCGQLAPNHWWAFLI